MKPFLMLPTAAHAALCIFLFIHALPMGASANPRIHTNKQSYLPGETVRVRYSGAPGAAGDWICIVPTSMPDNNAGPNWQYLPYAVSRGVLTFIAPYPGEYQARAYYDYRTIGYVVAARSSFKVARQASRSAPRAQDRREERTAVTSATPDARLKDAQYALMERGYDPGNADGLSGRRTRAAILAFQEDNRLEQTGALNRETLLALGLISGKGRGEIVGDHENKPVEPSTDRHDRYPEAASDKGPRPQDSKDTHTPADPPASPKVANPGPAETDSPGKGQITTTTTLAAEASAMAESLGEVPRGAKVDILGMKDNFFKIRYNGKEGYIYNSFIQRL